MSAHLPECPQFCDGKPPKCRGVDCTLCDEVDCYCDMLRACEQRVRQQIEDSTEAFRESFYKDGYDAALDVAEAAIRALKEKP